MGVIDVASRLFKTISSQYSRAGRSFRAAVEETKKYIPFTPQFKHRLQHEESNQYNFAKGFAKYEDRNKYVSNLSKIRTIANLSKRYQYLFSAKIQFENGMYRADPTVSVLSNIKLTPAQAEAALMKNLLKYENNYGQRITNISNIQLQGERRNITFP